jgi:hypothetical protein
MSGDTVVDHVRRLLVALIRYALLMETQPAAAQLWAERGMQEQARLREISPAEVHLDGVWAQAIGEAEAEPGIEDANVSMTLPQMCPLSWAGLMAPDFDMRAAGMRIRQSTATG